MIFFTNCSYQLYTNIADKKLNQCCNIKHITLYSYDTFGLITKAVRAELYKNRINIINDINNISNEQKTYICLYIINALENHITTSFFMDGTEAEYQLVLYVYAKLSISNKNYSINIQVYRDFIRNVRNSLFNEIQEDDIRKLMYQEAAEKLIFFINLY